jgi:hypothetical protein
MKTFETIVETLGEAILNLFLFITKTNLSETKIKKYQN